MASSSSGRAHNQWVNLVRYQFGSILEEFIIEDERVEMKDFISFVKSASRNEVSGSISEEHLRIILEDKDREITVLHLAALRGYANLCAYLIDNLGDDVNARCSDEDDTPLHAATTKNDIATVECLIERGADVNCKGQMGFTPLHIAAAHGYEELVRLLSRDSNIEATSAAGTPLLCAVGHAQKETVKVLLEKNANPNSASDYVVTPLHLSISCNSLLCWELIKAGADPNTRTCGTTPLCHAASHGLTEIINCLLNAGADPNARDVYGSTPLENAARQGYYECVNILLPLTSPNPSCHNWSLEGIVEHINSEEIRRQREHRNEHVFWWAKANGVKATQRKEYFNAIQWYSVAIEANPTDVSLYSKRSLCYAHFSVGDKALSDAKSYIALMPSSPKAYYREGVAWKLLKNYRKALEAFSTALTLDRAAWELRKKVLLVKRKMERKGGLLEATN